MPFWMASSRCERVAGGRRWPLGQRVASPAVTKSRYLTRKPQGLSWAWCVTSSGWFICRAGTLWDGCLVSPTVLLDTPWECWLCCRDQSRSRSQGGRGFPALPWYLSCSYPNVQRAFPGCGFNLSAPLTDVTKLIRGRLRSLGMG